MNFLSKFLVVVFAIISIGTLAHADLDKIVPGSCVPSTIQPDWSDCLVYSGADDTAVTEQKSYERQVPTYHLVCQDFKNPPAGCQ